MKIILLFLLITLSLVSCKKDSSGKNAEYFLHFKANGQAVDYDGDSNGSQFGAVWAERLNLSPTNKQLVIRGREDSFNYGLMFFEGTQLKRAKLISSGNLAVVVLI